MGFYYLNESQRSHSSTMHKKCGWSRVVRVNRVSRWAGVDWNDGLNRKIHFTKVQLKCFRNSLNWISLSSILSIFIIDLLSVFSFMPLSLSVCLLILVLLNTLQQPWISVSLKHNCFYLYASQCVSVIFLHTISVTDKYKKYIIINSYMLIVINS